MNSDEFIMFNADDLMLCAKASSVHCINDDVTTTPEPDTQPWFEGLAVVEGRLLPITNLGIYLGRKSSQGRVIEVAHHLGIFGLRVDDIQGVSNQYDENAYKTFDIAELVQSTQFLDIHCEPA